MSSPATNPLDNSQDFGAAGSDAQETYTIISAGRISDLIARVNQMQTQGWYPQGGVVVDETAGGAFYQAMCHD